MVQSRSHLAAKSLTWRVNGLQLAGLCWGDPGKKPLLALHGWLDNAASFAYLAPLLDDHYVVALDLTGHGLSARRSDDASYQIWDDLPEILGVLDALEWSECDLVGHSRGAIISTLVASAFPERVNKLVLLDAVVPDAVEDTAFPLQLRKALQDKWRFSGAADRVFPTLDAAIISRAARGLSTEAAKILVERNVRQDAQGTIWTTDARLRGASAVKMTQAQIVAVLKRLSMPTLLLLAHDSWGEAPELASFARQHIARLAVETMPGGHHFHMEANVAEVAKCMKQFLLATQEVECL
jgi:pimeloyl-ACP methyl ester carboxylesterase